MLDGFTMARFSLKGWAAVFARAFFDAANDAEHVEPVFNEAAGSGEDSGGGIKPAEFHKGILPGIRDSMIGDNIANRVLHNARKASATFSRDNLRSVHIK